MLNRYKHILCLFGLFFGFFADAAELPALKKAPEITVGSFSNGINYYITKNLSDRGFADFSLVRKSFMTKSEGREGLTRLEHFGNVKPYEFFSRNGVGYSKDGMLSRRDASVCYNFKNVPVSERAVCDSTLLMLFDLASLSQDPQAIIISGDVDAAAIIERMKMLALTISRRNGRAPENYYVWNPTPERTVSYMTGDYGELGCVTMSWRTPRASEKVMNTAQPLVFRMYSKVLGNLLCKRIERALRTAGIPLADISSRQRNSAQEPGDEIFSLSIWTAADMMEEATRLAAAEISHVDRYGVGFDEYSQTGFNTIVGEWKRAGIAVKPNSHYVEKCTSAFLFNDNLADSRTETEALTGARLTPQHRLDLFNKFCAAELDAEANLSIQFELPEESASKDVLVAAFDKGWASASLYKLPERTGSFYGEPQKIRLSRDVPEPISGGRMWTFSNGMKVIFKRIPGNGIMDFSLMLRGGFPEVEQLCPGEAAFTADMLMLSRFGGMNREFFEDTLQTNGVSLRGRVSVSNMTISGSAPSGKLPFVMKTLLTMANDREPGTDEFKYFRESETLRQELKSRSGAEVNSVMDSLMRPDYQYSGRKNAAALCDGFPARAEKYFANKFSNVSDGVFILSGDIEEESAKKILCAYLGGFRTSKMRAPRPIVAMTPASGGITVTKDGAEGVPGNMEPYANLALSANVPATSANNVNLIAAKCLVSDMLAREFADKGVRAEVSVGFEAFPKDRASMFINCMRCEASGLPEGVTPVSSYDVLMALRSFVQTLGRTGIAPQQLERVKKAVENYMARKVSGSAGLQEFAALRYCDGKDFVTDYSKNVKGITADSINAILGELVRGSRVEYISK